MKKIEFETFRTIGNFEAENLKQSEPSCFNGMVRVKKYRVIVEEIPEPDDVYMERLITMYKETDNSHDRTSISQYCGKVFKCEILDLVKRQK